MSRHEEAERHSEQPHIFNSWGQWLGGGYSRQLLNNYNSLGAAPLCINLNFIDARLSLSAPRPWPLKTMKKVIKGTQSLCLKLSKPKPSDSHMKLARALDKWRLGTYSHTHTDRAFRVLRTLKKLVPPK